MSQHFIFTTTKKFSKAQASRIRKAIAKLDETAEFVGPVSIPGNPSTGWLERPNDGTNDHNGVRARNREMADIVKAELNIKEV